MDMSKSAYTPNQLLDLLREFNIRASVHRLAVLRHVVDNKTHPTADEIFNALASGFPSLSRATVYNVLHVLTDNGILRELEIENNSTRYDFALQPSHGHFKCTCCGKIYDMTISRGLEDAVPDGFRADCLDVYAKGKCKDCIKHMD